MSTAENRKLFENIFASLAEGDGRSFLEALAEDFCWTMIGTTAWSGTYRGKEEVQRRLLGPLFAQFETRYRNRPHRIVAEGDFVAVECRGEVMSKTGKPYNNTYCWVCRVENGRIKELTEYMDTELVSSALTAPQAA